MRVENDELKAMDVYVGQRLRTRRLQLGLTLMNIAEKIGISHQQMQKYELGQTRLSAPILYQMAILYGVKSQYFFDGFQTYMRRLSGCTEDETRHEHLAIMALCDDPTEEKHLRQVVESAPEPVDLFFVHDGMQAMNVLRQKGITHNLPRPDLVFVDLDTSKKDGLSLLRDIKRDRDVMDIPVVVFASVVNQHILHMVYGYQAAGYISKHSDNFSNRVHQLINYWTTSVVLPFLQHDEVVLPEDWSVLQAAG